MPLLRWTAATSITLLVIAAVFPSLLASEAIASSTKEKLDHARQQFESLQEQIAAKNSELEALQDEGSELATRIAAGQARLDGLEGELSTTRTRLGQAQDRYAALRGQLDERAREAFVGGTASALSVILDSSSMADLSDRMAFVHRVAATDSDLAIEVGNLRVQLDQDAERLQELRTEQKRALENLQKEQARLKLHLEAQQAAYEELRADERRAEQLVADLGKQYRQQQAAAETAAAEAAGAPGGSNGGSGSNPFTACPVPGGAISDDFGAPRYGGGYHAHQGNDIFAPEGTPIHAAFSGTASSANNGLGGISVIVNGSQGYVYNAHMSGTAKLGQVQAGDVIGYVGDTGDAQGSSPHNHFEWHPGGGAAVDPHAYLLDVC
jgi:murein DD-endopeptidase MepM/ murein hydrolase activator NlpD